METKIENSKLYELVLKYKSDMEKNRDEINKYYTSLFSAFLSLMPFLLDKSTPFLLEEKDGNLRYVMIVVSLLGLILSISWKLTLQRIHNYLKGTEELLSIVEKNFEITFITYMSNYLYKTNSPARETKQAMLVPYSFIIIFIIVLVYSSWFFVSK